MFDFAIRALEEKKYVQEQTIMLAAMGMSIDEAATAAKGIVSEAVKESKASGAYGKGPLGNYMLNRIKTNPESQRVWVDMQKDGVTEKDVLEWWNLADVERRMMTKVDFVFQLGCQIDHMRSGETLEQAHKSVCRTFPVFGALGSKWWNTMDNSPEAAGIPLELKLRVVRWQERMAETSDGTARLKEMKTHFTCVNALIRKLIKDGEI